MPAILIFGVAKSPTTTANAINAARATLPARNDQAGHRRERAMTKTVKARFANGVLTPLEAIDLPEGALVSLDIGEISSTEPDAPATETEPSPVASRASISDRNEPVNYNRLNDELMDQEYFEKERRIRERNA